MKMLVAQSVGALTPGLCRAVRHTVRAPCFSVQLTLYILYQPALSFCLLALRGGQIKGNELGLVVGEGGSEEVFIKQKIFWGLFKITYSFVAKKVCRAKDENICKIFLQGT